MSSTTTIGFPFDCSSTALRPTRRHYSFDQWCQRRILRLHYSQHVSNHEVRRRTDCIPASEIIQSRRLKLFGHTARAGVELDHHVLQYEAHHPRGGGHQRPRQTWTRTIEADLRPLNIGLHNAWRRAQDRTTCREETREDSYAMPRGMLLMMMMMMMMIQPTSRPDCCAR